MVDSANNPYTYSDGPGVTTGVKSLSLLDSSGNVKNVTHTDEPFVMRFPGKLKVIESRSNAVRIMNVNMTCKYYV